MLIIIVNSATAIKQIISRPRCLNELSSLILYYIIIKELYPCLFVEGKMTFHLLITQWKNEARYKPFDLLHQHVSKV